jgi:hypothetical protein
MQAGEDNGDSFSNWVAAEARILKQDNNRFNASDLYLLRSLQAVLAKQLAANPVETDNTAELLAAVPGSLGKAQARKEADTPKVAKEAMKSSEIKTPVTNGSVPSKCSNKIDDHDSSSFPVLGVEHLVSKNGTSPAISTSTENVTVKSASDEGWLSPNDAQVRSSSVAWALWLRLACR